MSSTYDAIEWVRQNLHPTDCATPELIYDDMESQSGRSLPIIYQPFDLSRRDHWRDRGSLFDFLLATAGPGAVGAPTPLGRVLDFGPGDGWPSLILAPYAREVVGVDGSSRRVEVCRENARRLGLEDATFVHAPPGEALPFPDSTFDAATAASSVEQSPDPRASLAELFRVLRPGGRLRIRYESLDRYRGGLARDLWLADLGDGRSRLLLYDRRPDEEVALNYALTFSIPRGDVAGALGGVDGRPSYDLVMPERLAELRPYISDAKVSRTIHPSGTTLLAWLREIGFREARATHSGADFAGRLFDLLPADARPADLEGLDALLRPAVGAVVELLAPPGEYPITAGK